MTVSRRARRLAQWLTFSRCTADLAEEMAFHRDAIERDLLARGVSPADARTAARRAMGNETYMREEARGVWLWPWVEGVLHDAKGTLRRLCENARLHDRRRKPGVSIADATTDLTKAFTRSYLAQQSDDPRLCWAGYDKYP